jgi:hypothetical protein
MSRDIYPHATLTILEGSSKAELGNQKVKQFMASCGVVAHSLCYSRMAVAALGKPAVGQVLRREE